ncbi:TIGR02186 family protein [Hyphomicrobium sp.]|uniref:TIGR02186 family protein n=1 Tax=Hyphomicrobium sp. TaxID=82 RepID=UPI0025BF10EC|nr:TIGR02186 family protein [Hyphomicrobium sp.]MCC7253367.1 TIGR02186 family protein [Hyphomicrobium sp.]
MRLRAHRCWSVLLLAAVTAAWAPAGGDTRAQDAVEPEAELPDWGEPLRKRTQRSKRRAEPRAPAPQPARRSERGAERAGAEPAKEAVEADVSSRNIAITSAFTGTEVVVFGSVVNSRQPSAEAGYYDVIVVLEGMATPLTARRKSNVAGLWVNTQAFAFESVPSYYAIASTRPIEEIAEPALLARHAIGHDYARLAPSAHSVMESQPGELQNYKDAVIRIKQRDGLYIKRDYAVIFIGKSLFRASISLPANVPVGPLTARVYLLREGELLSTFQSRVRLERSGVELWLYQAAMRHPLYYGLAAVLVAALAGLIASMPFRRKPPA